MTRSVLEENKVWSVAELLGELVAYRAAKTWHLGLLAGILNYMLILVYAIIYFNSRFRRILVFSMLAKY